MFGDCSKGVWEIFRFPSPRRTRVSRSLNSDVSARLLREENSRFREKIISDNCIKTYQNKDNFYTTWINTYFYIIETSNYLENKMSFLIYINNQ